MKDEHESLGKILVIAGGLALVCYVAVFSLVQHQRSGKGPWEIVFTADAVGHPSLQISQARLGLASKLVFPDGNVGRTNFSERVEFGVLTTNLPFGEWLFQDPLYLPGNVTLRVCGHLIEVLPRTLRIDQVERPWPTAAEIVLPAKN